MKRILRLERIFIAQYLKQMLEYKGDFIIGVIGVCLIQGLNLVFLKIIFKEIPSLNGWSLNQILFIYGFSLIPKGIDHLLFDNLWAVGQKLVRKGEFDKYLTRPINPLFHILVECFQVDAIGELFIGIFLVISTFSSTHWTMFKVLIFVVVLPFATSIYTSLKIITSSIAFWTKESGNISYIFYMMNDFSKYPVNIYDPFIRWIISFIIPFAFTAYYPAVYFLTGRSFFFNIGGLIMISIASFLVALYTWNKGLLAYESAGS